MFFLYIYETFISEKNLFMIIHYNFWIFFLQIICLSKYILLFIKIIGFTMITTHYFITIVTNAWFFWLLNEKNHFCQNYSKIFYYLISGVKKSSPKRPRRAQNHRCHNQNTVIWVPRMKDNFKKFLMSL